MKNSTNKIIKKAYASIMTFMASASLFAVQASADTWDTVTVDGSSADAGTLMGKIIGIILTIARYAGIALTIWGIIDIVMSFVQQQPEAKTKGIYMALSGVVMIVLKSIISGLGLIS